MPCAPSGEARLLALIPARWGVISLSQFRRHGRDMDQPEVAERTLRALAKAGHGTFRLDPPGPKGGRPALRFRLFETKTP